MVVPCTTGVHAEDESVPGILINVHQILTP